MLNPKVSVIVPVYNVEKYLHKCIDTILSQTFSDFECILVNDCSPDNCGKICDEYANKDNRIKVIHKQVNEGLPQARKTGFLNSSGEYILNVDSDDYIEITMIEKMLSLAVLNDYDFVYSDYYKHLNEETIIYQKVPILSNDYVYNIKSTVLGKIGSVLWNKLIKKSVYNFVNFPLYSYGEDRVIAAQILYHSKNTGYINEALYHYINNQNSLQRNPTLKWKRYTEVKENFNNIKRYLKSTHNGYPKVFEPELSLNQKGVIRMYPLTIRNIIKSLIPPKLLSKLKGIYK